MSKLTENLMRFKNYRNQHGIVNALKRVVHELRSTNTRAVISSVYSEQKISVFKHYDAILGHSLGTGIKITRDNVPDDSITWVVPDFEASSGGHINIFRMVKNLQALGINGQHVVITDPNRWLDSSAAKQALLEQFGLDNIQVSLGVHTIEPCKYLFATSWQTAYWVAKYKDVLHRCYFVQDYEPMFYASGTEFVLAENTYKLGLVGVTAGNWLADKLKNEYGMKTHPYSFSYDKHLYEPKEKKSNENRHIFFYARPVTPRRCFELGLLALGEVCKRLPNVAVILAGWDVSNYEIPFHNLNAGVVPLNELAELYSQCDVALVLSGSNLSLLPMEIAACGTPIVMNNSENCSWLFKENEIKYCDMSVNSIADAIIDVLGNPVESKKMSQRALKSSIKSDWMDETKSVLKFLKNLDAIE